MEPEGSYRFHSSSPSLNILVHINRKNTLPLCFSPPRSTVCLFSSDFQTKILYIFLTNSTRATCPASLLQTHSFLLIVRSKYSPQHSVLEHPQFCVLHLISDTKFHTHTKQQIKLYKISGSHGCDYKENSLLGHGAVWSLWSRPWWWRQCAHLNAGIVQRDYTALYPRRLSSLHIRSTQVNARIFFSEKES
jgi:hypothetical protein